jgi:DAK2 domain fusion protein YloV
MPVKMDGKYICDALALADSYLSENEELINALNVFPIPDGDTGTNMAHTLHAVMDKINDKPEGTVKRKTQALARTALINARGNSGVILAQFLDGFVSAMNSRMRMSFREFTDALKYGTEAAYRAIADPKEGTILTVMRACSDEARALEEGDIATAARGIFNAGYEALSRTREILPELKEAGVVDSGGLGFLYFMKGFLDMIVPEPISFPASALLEGDLQRMETYKHGMSEIPSTHFCLEFILNKVKLPIKEIRERLSKTAESVVIVEDKEMAHIHIHTDDPDKALTQAASFGDMVKLDDMFYQIRQSIDGHQDIPQDLPALIPVVSGEGLAEIMRNLGAAGVIVSSKMNPSVGEILGAVSKLPHPTAIVLPNDKNVILSAEHAAKLSEKEILVVSSKSIPQGISALLTQPQGRKENFLTAMTAAIQRVKSGEVSRAVRKTSLSGVEIEKDDYIGFYDG